MKRTAGTTFASGWNSSGMSNNALASAQTTTLATAAATIASRPTHPSHTHPLVPDGWGRRQKARRRHGLTLPFSRAAANHCAGHRAEPDRLGPHEGEASERYPRKYHLDS